VERSFESYKNNLLIITILIISDDYDCEFNWSNDYAENTPTSRDQHQITFFELIEFNLQLRTCYNEVSSNYETNIKI